MAVFKVPKISTAARLGLVLEVAEIVMDTEKKIYFGGDGETPGGIPLGKGSSGNVESFVLTQQNIDNKKVSLSTVPFYPDKVTMTIIGGINQVNGVDFEVIGSDISWNGLGLDNFLEVNEQLIIQY